MMRLRSRDEWEVRFYHIGRLEEDIYLSFGVRRLFFVHLVYL
jgi:hypothetical protein